MKAIGVIPARLAATRLPNKPLLDIAGKPMVQWVWERSARATLLDEVIVATPDTEIVQACAAFGAHAVLTDADLPTGTDRVAQAVQERHADLVVNIQGDEPLTEPDALDALVRGMEAAPDAALGSLMFPLDETDDPDNPNLVKVVCTAQGDAIYFSRSAIPYARGLDNPPRWGHIGIYAWRREALFNFAAMERSPLEVSESLEQLRALEAGWKIRMVKTSYRPVGVDTPEDLQRARAALGG